MDAKETTALSAATHGPITRSCASASSTFLQSAANAGYRSGAMRCCGMSSSSSTSSAPSLSRALQRNRPCSVAMVTGAGALRR